MKTVLIVGITADIGRELGRRFAADGWRVAGTHRAGTPVDPVFAAADLAACDLAVPAEVEQAIAFFRARDLQWDVVVVAAGTEEPIGPFFASASEAWERGLAINAFGPLRLLRGVYPLRRRDGGAHVALLAGAGTNGPAPAYSAYSAAKILLIKLCELLDAECPDTSFFIIGPGIVRTKIHEETLRAADRSGENLRKVQAFLASEHPGTSHDEIYQCLHWCVAAGKSVVGGRNLALAHDAWRNGGAQLAAALKANPDLYKLRRFGNELRFRSSSE
jgi:NAD(P)-dependent dehydrogenase (short-subunit alcohol dehydrogenase family)